MRIHDGTSKILCNIPTSKLMHRFWTEDRICEDLVFGSSYFVSTIFKLKRNKKTWNLFVINEIMIFISLGKKTLLYMATNTDKKNKNAKKNVTSLEVTHFYKFLNCTHFFSPVLFSALFLRTC